MTILTSWPWWIRAIVPAIVIIPTGYLWGSAQWILWTKWKWFEKESTTYEKVFAVPMLLGAISIFGLGIACIISLCLQGIYGPHDIF